MKQLSKMEDDERGKYSMSLIDLLAPRKKQKRTG